MKGDCTLYVTFLATTATVCHYRTILHLLLKWGGRCDETRKSNQLRTFPMQHGVCTFDWHHKPEHFNSSPGLFGLSQSEWAQLLSFISAWSACSPSLMVHFGQQLQVMLGWVLIVANSTVYYTTTILTYIQPTDITICFPIPHTPLYSCSSNS